MQNSSDLGHFEIKILFFGDFFLFFSKLSPKILKIWKWHADIIRHPCVLCSRVCVCVCVCAKNFFIQNQGQIFVLIIFFWRKPIIEFIFPGMCFPETFILTQTLLLGSKDVFIYTVDGPAYSRHLKSEIIGAVQICGTGNGRPNLVILRALKKDIDYKNCLYLG